MAAGTIITVLANVPWGQVIDAAPKVAEGASKLWGAVTRRKKDDTDLASEASAPPPAAMPPQEALAHLHAEVQALRASVGDLRDELVAATGLIKQLADQNTILVQRVELQRRRLAQVTYITAAVGVMLLSALGFWWVG